ncbi:MAG: Crp/Fnr family transcriptional regulator [Cyanobacteria bacterium P01_D01_bin.14]
MKLSAMELIRPETLTSELQDCCQFISLVPDQRLFRQGDAATRIFLLTQGRLRLFRRTVEKREITLAVTVASGILGEEALFDKRYGNSAIADTTTQLIAYPIQPLRSAIVQEPGIANQLLMLVGQKVQSLQTLIELRSIRSATLRVQQYLRYRSQGLEPVRLEGTWKAIASELSLTPQTLSKALAQLEQTGQIERRPEGIYLPERA